MLEICRDATEMLNDAEALLKYAPDMSQFVYTSMRDVKELRQIARHETDKRMTAEQVKHINHITSTLDRMLSNAPRDFYDQEADDD